MLNWKVMLLLKIIYYVGRLFGWWKACIICDSACSSYLHASALGYNGKNIALCTYCFDDNSKLMHAYTYARASWQVQ